MAVWELLKPSKTSATGALLHRGGHTATVVGERIYVVAGRKGSRFWRDLLCYCTRQQSWQVLQKTVPLPARANHHAVLVGGSQLWVMGGADEGTVYGDAWVLDVHSLTWTQPQLRGATELLGRCSAGADIHPTMRHVILLFGGYGLPVAGTAHGNHYNDIVSFNTKTGEVSSLCPSGPAPSPRCFHTFSTVENLCWVVGGRIIEQGPLEGDDMVAVYDPLANAWLPCHRAWQGPHKAGAGGGTESGPRSSHKAVAVGSRLLVTGGNLGQPDTPLAVWLRLEAGRGAAQRGGKLLLEWSNDALPQAGPGSPEPQARAAHGANLIGNCVYLSLGYTGVSPKAYLPDVLALRLDASQLAGLQPHAAVPSGDTAPHTHTHTHTHTVARAVGVWDAGTGEQRVQATVKKMQCTGAGQSDVPDTRPAQQPAPADKHVASPVAIGAKVPGTTARPGGTGPASGLPAVLPSSPLPPATVRAKQRTRHPSGAAPLQAPGAGAADIAVGHGHVQTPVGAGASAWGGRPAGTPAAVKRRALAEAVVDLTGSEEEARGVGLGVEKQGIDGSGWQRKKPRGGGAGSPRCNAYATLSLHNGGRAEITPTAPLATSHAAELHAPAQMVHAAQGSGYEAERGTASGADGDAGTSHAAFGPGAASLHRLRTAQQHSPTRQEPGAVTPHRQLGMPTCPYHTCSSPNHHVAYVDQTQVQLLQQQLADIQLQLSKGQQAELLARSRAEMDCQALEALRSSLADARATLAHKSSELANTEAALREAQKQANSVVLQHQSLVTEKNQWMLERQHMQQDSAAMQARCKELESHVHALKTSLEACQAESLRSTSQFEQRLAAKDIAATEQADRISTLLASLEALRTENTRCVEVQRGLERDVVEGRERLAQAQRSAATQLEAAAGREAELREALEQRTAELKAAQHQNTTQAAELAMSKAQNVHLVADISASRQAASAANATCQDLRAQLSALQSNTQQAGKQLTEDLRKRREEIQRVMNEMQRSADTFEASVCDQQALAQASA